MKEKMVLLDKLIIVVVGDSLSFHVGMKFTTYDADNDVNTGANCANTQTGGWWYIQCHVFSFFIF